MKKRILLAWECGGGFGHAVRLLHIARRLQQEGYLPILALRYCDRHRELAATHAAQDAIVIQAPHFQPSGMATLAARSFADLLTVAGFGDQNILTPLLRGWEKIIRTHRPDAVICDYSPTLQLFAQDKLPLILTGNGFVVPPGHGPDFPVLNDRAPPFMPLARVMAAVTASCRSCNLPAIDRLPALYTHPACIDDLAILDIYAADRKNDRTPDRFTTLLRKTTYPCIPPPEHAPVFIYLAAGHPELPAIIRAIKQQSGHFSAFIKGSTPVQQQSLAEAGVRIHKTLPDLATLLPTVRGVIHGSGIGLAQEALLAGVPQLLMPTDLEKTLTAAILAKTARSLVVHPGAGQQAFDTAVHTLCTASPEQALAAGRFYQSQLPALSGEDVLVTLLQRALS